MPLSYRDLKQTKEKQSQQSSQEINDKYFLSNFPSEAMLTDLFSLHEQYFEIQEKEFLTSSTNVKGRLTENIGFWDARITGACQTNFFSLSINCGGPLT